MNLKLFWIAVWAAVLGFRSLIATTIDPLMWQQLAEDADFIGIVECKVAGGIVARYRVVERWKGNEAAGDEMNIRIALDYWGPRYPVVLVGERYLVTAFRNRAPSQVMSTTLGGPVPLWWRKVPWDFQLPLYQGAVRLDEQADRHPESGPMFYRLGSDRERLAEVRADFRDMLTKEPEERALMVLHALAKKYLSTKDYGKTPTPELAGSFLQVKTADEAARLLVEKWDAAGDTNWPIEAVVQQSPLLLRRKVRETARSPKDTTYTVKAGDTLVRIAAALSAGRDHRGMTAFHYEIFLENRALIPAPERLRIGSILKVSWRGGLVIACREDEATPTPVEPTARVAPSAEDLQRAAAIFDARKEDSAGFQQAMELLIEHDPSPVLRWLQDWRAPTGPWPANPEAGYPLGSWAAVRCGGNRVRNLSTLLDAHDPLVRVAAAVHLAYEDETLGIAALRKLSELPGDPGSWAALALARRGDRVAFVRAIEALEKDDREQRANQLVRDMLVDRVLELLSNSATAIGLPTPVWHPGEDAAERAHGFVRQHPRLVPVDPWFSLLREQKLD